MTPSLGSVTELNGLEGAGVAEGSSGGAKEPSSAAA
jgi:hypothetical protein